MKTSIVRSMFVACVGASMLLSATVPLASAHEGDACRDHEDTVTTARLRRIAAKRIAWRRPGHQPGKKPVRVQILGFNDFHGQLSEGRFVSGRPVGGAAVLASYLAAEQAAFQGATFIVHAGDHVGATPPASALLQDEPSITFLNKLGNRYCSTKHRNHPKCNVIGTLGNHEFDEGVDELLRLLHGGNHANGPFLERRYRGAAFPYVSSNVVDAERGRSLLQRSVVRRVDGVAIGFVGAVLQDTPTIVTPTGVAGLEFLDEAQAINREAARLRHRGVETIIVLIHQGGSQSIYSGPTEPDAAGPTGAIADIVANLDDSIDVVVSGHAHAFSNAFLPNSVGNPVLVVQAFSGGTAYDDIELAIDRRTGDVVESSAAVVTTFADEVTPDAHVAELVQAAEDAVAPLVNRVVAEAAGDITRTQSAAGESALGNLIADAQRTAMSTDIAFMNPGGIRADLGAGEVTWGDLFTIQPFGNSLVRMNLLGSQVLAVLEQQWQGQPFPRIMQVSGLGYTWDPSAPEGSRIVQAHTSDGLAIDPAATYSVTANSFMAAGGDNFTTFVAGTDREGGPIDLDALEAYIVALGQPFSAAIEGRIQVVP